jgi:hypothetical protein
MTTTNSLVPLHQELHNRQISLVTTTICLAPPLQDLHYHKFDKSIQRSLRCVGSIQAVTTQITTILSRCHPHSRHLFGSLKPSPLPLRRQHRHPPPSAIPHLERLGLLLHASPRSSSGHPEPTWCHSFRENNHEGAVSGRDSKENNDILDQPAKTGEFYTKLAPHLDSRHNYHHPEQVGSSIKPLSNQSLFPRIS